jgi:hypothetical protein
MEFVAGTEAPSAPRYGWFNALCALLGGSIVAYLPLIVVAFVLDGALHVLPANTPSDPGVGWPWRIDGAWAACADLGPLLCTAALLAAGIGFYVGSRVGHPTARWPIVVCAAVVGWIPVAQGGRPGLLGVSGGLGFVAMWWTTRMTAAMPRPRLPAPIRPRVAAAAVAGAAVSLGAVSVAYGALHPVRVEVFIQPAAATLHNGRTPRFPISVFNDGPLTVRIRGVSLAASPDLRLARLEREGPQTEGPTIDSLYSPAGTPRIPSRGELQLWLTLSGPTACIAMPETVSALDVHLSVAGVDRTQRVHLAPNALVVNCRVSRHR